MTDPMANACLAWLQQYVPRQPEEPDPRPTQGLRLHCVYCGATTPATTIRYAAEPPAVQATQLAFEREHDARCGPKSVGIILDLPDRMAEQFVTQLQGAADESPDRR
jgi:hypothetical protein